MRLVLHIGTEKTGSTTIQNWLYENQDVLEQNRVRLSRSLTSPNNRSLVHCFQTGMDEFFEKKGVQTENQWRYFCEVQSLAFSAEVEASSHDHDVFILTSEHFHSRLVEPCDIDQFVDFLRGFFSEILVVCYFRNQIDMCVSKYSTAMYAGKKDRPCAYLLTNIKQASYYDLFDLAQRWAAVIGRENTRYRNFDVLKRSGIDIRQDFLAASGLDALEIELTYRASSENLSLHPATLRVFRLINIIVPMRRNSGTFNYVNRALKKISQFVLVPVISLAGKRQIYIPDELLHEVQCRYGASNDRLRDEFSIDLNRSPRTRQTPNGTKGTAFSRIAQWLSPK